MIIVPDQEIIVPTPEKIFLSDVQSDVFRLSQNSRFIGWCAGRGSGKTTICASFLKTWVSRKPGDYIYVAPTRRDAKDIFWEMIKNSVHPMWMKKKPNESELKIFLKNGAQIQLLGACSDTIAVGRTLDGVIIDEVSKIRNQDIWFKNIRPALARKGHQGPCIFISTPQGFDWFYDLCMKARVLKGWSYYHSTSLQGGFISEEEIETARLEMTEKMFRQEFEATFESFGGRVFYGFDRNLNVSADVTNDLTDVHEIHVGMDFNINPMTAIIGKKVGGEMHIFDEMVLFGSNTPEMIESLKTRYGSKYIIVYPDASGGAGDHRSRPGTTDMTMMQEAGLSIYCDASNPSVVDRNENTNRLFKNAAGTSTVFISPKCSTLIKSLDGLTYKEGGERIVDKKNNLDHACDAIGYMLWQLYRPYSISSKLELQW